MASGPDHMRASASSEPLVDREWQATTAVAALTSALDEPHAVAQPAEHVVVRRDSSREEREGMSEASVGTELSAPPAIAVARNSFFSPLSACAFRSARGASWQARRRRGNFAPKQPDFVKIYDFSRATEGCWVMHRDLY